MAVKSAGGRFSDRLTGEFNRITGSLAAYLNRRADPRLGPVELICFLGAIGAEIWVVRLQGLPASAAALRFLPGVGADLAMAAWLGTALVAYTALLFLLELPAGARIAGALLATAVLGALMPCLAMAGAPPLAAAATLVAVPALLIRVRCRTGLGGAVAVAAGATLLLVLVRRLLNA